MYLAKRFYNLTDIEYTSNFHFPSDEHNCLWKFLYPSAQRMVALVNCISRTPYYTVILYNTSTATHKLILVTLKKLLFYQRRMQTYLFNFEIGRIFTHSQDIIQLRIRHFLTMRSRSNSWVPQQVPDATYSNTAVKASVL